jgi:peptidoglycan/xylan/chitin deacetylase (PgdA/CDA1 family)
MRKRLLLFIAACLYYSGLVALARWWQRGPRLVILNYHRASGGDLRHHLLYLSRHYRILHIEAALEELYGQPKNGRRRPTLALTFDDGYHDNYTHVFPLACKLQIPFTVYLLPGYIETGACFWWLEGDRLAWCTQVQEAVIDGRIYHLNRAEERNAMARVLDLHLRAAQSVAEREDFLASMRKKLACPAPAQSGPSLPLTWEQVRAMEKSGWASYGAHTMHHPILAYLTDKAELAYEVTACRATLEWQLGHPVRTFAYPIGQMRHISEDVRKAVRLAGYTWACTTSYGINTWKSDPYLLKRIEVDVDQHWLIVAAEAAGLWGFLSRLRWNGFVRRHFTNAYSV